jgi:hypothetical protein
LRDSSMDNQGVCVSNQACAKATLNATLGDLTGSRP